MLSLKWFYKPLFVFTLASLCCVPWVVNSLAQGIDRDTLQIFFKDQSSIGDKSAAFKGATQLSMFDLYADNRAQGIPNYITEDLLITVYALALQKTQMDMEAGKGFDLLLRIVSGLAENMSGASDAAVANANYLAILKHLLLGPRIESDNDLSKVAKSELKLILRANSVKKSPLWGTKVDYTQFKPRGYYASSDKLKRYFQAIKYANSILFSVQPSKSTGVSAMMSDRFVEQSYLFAAAFLTNPGLQRSYEEFNALFDWRIGIADDLTIQDLQRVAVKNVGMSIKSLKTELLKYAKKHDRQPNIIQGFVNKKNLEATLTVADVMTGWRFIPSRYTSDSHAFQQLVYGSVKEYENLCDKCGVPFSSAVISGRLVKAYPLVAELMSLNGSLLAKDDLEAANEIAFDGYLVAYQKAQDIVDAAQGLNAEHYKLMHTVLSVASSDDEIKSDRRTLTSMMGFWTWVRYTQALYAKQSYTIGAKSFLIDEDRVGATIEPAITLYESLITLIQAHRKLSDHLIWKNLERNFATLLAIAQRVYDGRKLSEEDETVLNHLDKELKDIVGLADEPIIVDIHTVPSDKKVLYSALGWTKIVHSSDGIARGGLFTHYEFKAPLSERFDNTDWQVLIGNSKDS